MNKYRYIALSALAVFLVSTLAIMILLFGSAFGYLHLNFNVANVVGPASGIIFPGLAIGVLVLNRSFRRTISRLLAIIDTSKLEFST
jgi:hypothetical protein